jgi:hypothetical protein
LNLVLTELLNTYREAIQECFDAETASLSKSSAIVKPYNLPVQAKAAVTKYVSTLRHQGDAKGLHDDHPIRLSYQAATFDRPNECTHEFTWLVPRSGWETNFWIPLRITPAQETYWHDLVRGDQTLGQSSSAYTERRENCSQPSNSMSTSGGATERSHTSGWISEKLRW